MNYACKNKNNPINYLPKIVFQDARIVQAEDTLSYIILLQQTRLFLISLLNIHQMHNLVHCCTFSEKYNYTCSRNISMIKHSLLFLFVKQGIPTGFPHHPNFFIFKPCLAFSYKKEIGVLFCLVMLLPL